MGTRRKSWIDSLRAWFDLIRIFNLPIPIAAILVGAGTDPAMPADRWVWLPLAGLLGCASVQCFNDYEDRFVDAQNAAFRPIPSGRLRARDVLAAGHGCVVVWVLLSMPRSPYAAAIVVLVYLLTRWYSRAKRATLAHHLLLPAALGLLPLYGSLMVSGTVAPLAVFAGVSIFLIDINMNIIGAFKDLWDGSVHERVLPVVWGARPAIVLALIVGLVGVSVQTIPVLTGRCGALPLVLLACGAGLTISSRLRLYRSPRASVGASALASGRLTECLTFPALLAGMWPATEALVLIAGLTTFALVTQALFPESRLPPGADLELS